MKEYPSIAHSAKAPREYCYAFYKYDGSNLRFEWHKKRGWSRRSIKMIFKSMLDLGLGDLVYIHNAEGYYHQHTVIKPAFEKAGWVYLRLRDQCECEYEIKSYVKNAQDKLFWCRDVRKELEDAGVLPARRHTTEQLIKDFGFTEEELKIAFTYMKEKI